MSLVAPTASSASTASAVSTKTPRTFFHWLAAMRGIASLAVVLHHTGMLSLRYQSVPFLGNFFNYGHVRVDFFFVLSGFLIFYLHAGQIGRGDDAKIFAWKRFWRLFPILFILNCLKLALLLIDGNSTRLSSLDATTIVSSFLAMPLNGLPLIVVAWTMAYEVCFCGMFLLLMLTTKKLAGWMLAAWAVLIILLNPPFTSLMAFPLSFWFNGYFLEFIGGTLVAYSLRRGWLRHAGWWLLALGLLILTLGLMQYDIVRLWYRTYRAALWAVAFMLFIGGLASIEKEAKRFWRPPWLLDKLGKASYSTFLSHSFVLIAILPKLTILKDLPIFAAQGLLIAVALASIITGWFIYLFVEKPITEWSKRFIRLAQAEQRNLSLG
jgi:peptidoglycan/LPS O-acetylase OafA/YrhL